MGSLFSLPSIVCMWGVVLYLTLFLDTSCLVDLWLWGEPAGKVLSSFWIRLSLQATYTSGPSILCYIMVLEITTNTYGCQAIKILKTNATMTWCTYHYWRCQVFYTEACLYLKNGWQHADRTIDLFLKKQLVYSGKKRTEATPASNAPYYVQYTYNICSLPDYVSSGISLYLYSSSCSGLIRWGLSH